ncbi:MAG: DHH family phosphoesterase, partial [Clostridia bacterium]|nr:DHH family phosphoesterase [Clostridia bacterium]
MRPKKTLIDKLLAGDDYIIIGHVAPDGDAVGSCMAMMLALEQLGKRAFICLADGMPKMFESFPFAERVITPDRPLPVVPKTGLAVDRSEKYRMGTAELLYDACGTKLMIDHHGTNTGFGDEWWIDGEAAAVGEMLTALIEEMGVTIDKNIATWLYISIFTDCGRFGYSNTRPETHLAAAKLVAAGVDVAKLTNKIFLEQSVARTKLQGAVLSTIRTTADGRIAWAKLTEQMLADTGALREDDDGISSTLVQMRG